MKFSFECVAAHMKIKQMNLVREDDKVNFNRQKNSTKISLKKFIWLKRFNQNKIHSLDTTKIYRLCLFTLACFHLFSPTHVISCLKINALDYSLHIQYQLIFSLCQPNEFHLVEKINQMKIFVVKFWWIFSIS